MQHNLSRLMLTLLAGFFLSPTLALAQSQDSQNTSVAEAARRAREKKRQVKAPAPVVTDDTLHPSASSPVPASPNTKNPAAPNQAAQDSDEEEPRPAPPAAPSSSAPEAQAVEQKVDADKAAEELTRKIETLKKNIAAAEHELDLAKRELALEQDGFYSNPDHEHDRPGKARIDSLQRQVNDKQQAVTGLKSQLAELQPTAPPQ